MKKLLYLCLFCFIGIVPVFAQQHEEKTLKTATGTIYGTLTIPVKAVKVPVVLIIAGSGPTDRNGNNVQMQNNSLLRLADSLAQHGIASLRYDKRGIAASKAAAPDESKLRFDAYIGDVVDWLALLHKDKRFSRYYIFGHSEGSLIGMLAAKKTSVNGYISVEGPSQPADVVLLGQMRSSASIPKGKVDTMTMLIDELRKVGKIKEVPGGFYQAFLRQSVQGYFASWMKFNPAKEIAGVKVPTLIIQGTTDLEVDTLQAKQLAAAAPHAKLVIIPGMNHIFKAADPGDLSGNSATYFEGDSPIMTELVQAVSAFINGAKKTR